MTAQRQHGALIGAGRAAQSEIDTARVEGFQGAKLFGNHQRCVVRQHDPAGAEAQRFGVSGEIANQHRRCGAGDAGHVVVFGQPVAMKAKGFSLTRQRQRIMEGIARRRALRNGGQIQYGQANSFLLRHGYSSKGWRR